MSKTYAQTGVRVMIIWIIGGLFLWMCIGAAVWEAIDTEERDFWKWYSACDPRIAWFAQPLVLLCWPGGMYLWINKDQPDSIWQYRKFINQPGAKMHDHKKNGKTETENQ